MSVHARDVLMLAQYEARDNGQQGGAVTHAAAPRITMNADGARNWH
jgi:hypothetical protein